MAADTGITDLTKKNRRVASAGLVLLFLLPPVSFGADVGGGIRVGAAYTDNVFLDTSPNEIDEIVFQASPFVSLVHESPQFDANVNYAFDWFRYSDLKTTSKYHRGEASVTGKAWEDSLTGQLGLRRSQVLSDPDGVIPQGRLPLSGNLNDEDEWWFNPRLNRRLGTAVTLDANYRYSQFQFDNSQIQENTNQSGDFNLENYKAAQGLTWALRYDWRRTEYEIASPWEYQQAKVELGFWVGPKTRIFGAGGRESAYDNPFDPAMDDSLWEAGFAYSPTENLSAEFAAGERSFGSSWRGRLDYTFRRGSTSLSYDETPTTSGFNRGRGTRNVLDPDNFDNFLDRPGSAERYVAERLEWALNLNFRRTGFDLTVFNENRVDRISAVGVPLSDQSQTGVRAKFSWQAGVRTELAVSGSVVDQETDAVNKSKFIGVELDVTYRLGTRSDLSLGYAHSEQNPRDGNLSGRDYVANVVSLLFTFTM